MTQSRALLCALAAFMAWVVVDTIIKYFCQAPVALSPFVIMAALGFFGAASLLIPLSIKRETALLRPVSLTSQIAIALCSIGINFANVIALKHLTLTMFYVLVFTTPLAIAGLSAALKHETLSPTKIICLIVGFAGTVLAIGFNLDGSDKIGVIAVSVSVVLFAIDTILIRNVAHTDSAESTQFFTAVATSLFGFTGAAIHGDSFPAWLALVAMLFAGAINTLGNVLYNRALGHTSSSNVAQLHYTQIVAGALIGYVLWHEIPTWNLVAGSVFIIVAGMFVAVEAHKKGFVS